MVLGPSVRRLRILSGMRQFQLAKKIGITNVAISNIERNVTWPEKKMIHKLCEAFGVSVSTLMLMSLEEKDVPLEKKELFNVIVPLLTDIILTKTKKKNERHH